MDSYAIWVGTGTCSGTGIAISICAGIGSCVAIISIDIFYGQSLVVPLVLAVALAVVWPYAFAVALVCP